ncbi:MAG: hypothetical protein JJ858_17430 [Rhizobiaceae bacterium]|nr:hypothetical protein [Rhizobiaceae bacterium]
MTRRRDLKFVTIKPAYELRLEDLREWHVLAVTCDKCGAQGVISPAQLLKRNKPYMRIILLQKKFRCNRCKIRGASTWKVAKLARD